MASRKDIGNKGVFNRIIADMVVSSNTLFQFAGSIDTIVKILQSGGFWPKYCIEFGWRERLTFDFAVPQCCFCDIPLSAIQSHMTFYGDYGIGMTKDWGIKNGLSPVMYVIPGSHFVKTINAIRQAAKGVEENTRFFAFLKRYKGVNYRKRDGKWEMRQNYLYYNEREWRYVPANMATKDLILKVEDKEKFDSNTLSQRTLTYLCHFKADDIRYIMVANNEDRIILIEEIMKMSNWSKSEKDLLSSKILTLALIKEDI